MGKWALCAAGILLLAGLASADTIDVVSNPNVAIPDYSSPTPGTASTQIVVGTSGTITDLNVDIIIEHTWQGDLIIELEKVGGPTVPLIYRPGDSDGSGVGFSADNFGNFGTGTPFVFDDEAASFYDSAPSNGIGATADPGIANVIGSWRPYGSQASGLTDTLATFDGYDSAGTWILHVSDNAGGDTGTIRQFSLHFTTGDTGSQTSPVPEPGTLALVLATAGLALVRRRRRQRAA